MRVQRFDVGRLEKAQACGAGGYRIPAFVARTGVQTYRQDDGREIREYRDPDEVLGTKTLESLEGAAITIGHVAMVDPSNWSELSQGHVVKVDGSEKVEGEDFIKAILQVNRGEAIERIRNDELSECSCGYTCEIDPTPGVTPTGERYDQRQTNILHNHVALGSRGFARAGRQARLRLDGNQEQETEKKSMPIKLKFDGLTHELTEENVGEFQTKLDSKISGLETDKGTLEARAVRAEETLSQYKEGEANRFDGMVLFRESMRKILGEDYRFDGKDPKQVKLDAIRKISPKATILLEENPAVARVDAFLEAYSSTKSEDYTPRIRVDENELSPKRNHVERLDALYSESFK